MEFYRPEYWSGWPFPSPGDLPNPGIEPRSPALQVDSLPAEPELIKGRFFLECLLVVESDRNVFLQKLPQITDV